MKSAHDSEGNRLLKSAIVPVRVDQNSLEVLWLKMLFGGSKKC